MPVSRMTKHICASGVLGVSSECFFMYLQPQLFRNGCRAEEGAVRLVGRVDINGFAMGAIQVFRDGAWGLVCDTNFGDRDAVVACRQLGFSAGMEMQLTHNQIRSGFPDLVRPSPQQ